MKKPIITLAICMVFSILLVITLYGLSNHQRRTNNNFTRLVISHPVKLLDELELKYDSYYIAGASGDQIYLANTRHPGHLFITNFKLTDTLSVALRVKNTKKSRFQSIYVSVRPPYFYIMDGIMPRVLRGDINTWMADSFMMDKAAYFTDIQPMGPSSFAIRTTSRKTGEFALGKIIPEEPYSKIDTTLLQKQIDGKFCTDGKLMYDQEAGQIVYLYHYRNQYIVADTSLNLQLRGNTIDTVTHAQLTTAHISSESSYNMSSPPLVVNEASCASNGLLFIKSPLLSKNESSRTLKHVSIIDVYNLKEGTYKFSFYIGNFGDESVSEFKVFGNKMVVKYSKRIQTYELMPRYFFEKEIL